MGNSILNNNRNQPNGQQGANNFFNSNMIQQFNQFRNTFRGNPQQMVMNMLQQGAMSNAQFQQLSQLASQFQQFLR